MARKSRKGAGTSITAPEIRIWRAAIYARLSVEDGGKKDSDTLESQVALIEEYAAQKPYLKIAGTYLDNGATGTNFERRGFTRMMDDIKAGSVNCVIVKDSSRFGRNYIETLEHLEKIFPFMGIRFISVNDAYDSEAVSGSDGLILMLKSLIDDAYAKDISRKVLSSVKTRQESGIRTGFPPYGYKKIYGLKGRIEPDIEIAPIVCDIFRWRADGLKYTEIVRRLNERGIPCPSMRYGDGRANKSIVKVWQTQAVRDICRDISYIGHTASGKTREALCENKPEKHIPRADWIVVENTQEPLIDNALWEAAQKMYRPRNKQDTTDRQTPENIFKGLIICRDCGSRMQRNSVTLRGKTYLTFRCRLQSVSCSTKHLREGDLYEIVWTAIRNEIDLCADMAKAIERIAKSAPHGKTDGSIADRIGETERQIVRKRRLATSLYESYIEHILTESEYLFAKQEYLREIETLTQALNELRSEQRVISEILTPDNKYLSAFAAFRDEKVLSCKILEALIDRIEVFDHHNVEIFWKHRDEYVRLKNYIHATAPAKEAMA